MDGISNPDGSAVGGSFPPVGGSDVDPLAVPTARVAPSSSGRVSERMSLRSCVVAAFRLSSFCLVTVVAAGCCRGGSRGTGTGPSGSGAAADKGLPSIGLPAILGGAGDKDFPVPGNHSAPALAAGAWSKLRISKGGQPSGEQTVKVLSVSGDQVRVEIQVANTSQPAADTIVQALLRTRDRRLPSGLDILEAQLKRGAATPLKLSGAQLKTTKQLLGNQFDIFAYPDSASTPQREDVTVPAGTFHGCMVADRESTITMPILGAIKSVQRTWYHPAVKTNGVVKQEVTSNGQKQLYELTAFAASGATSSL
jgi:hypothetical protein